MMMAMQERTQRGDTTREDDQHPLLSDLVEQKVATFEAVVDATVDYEAEILRIKYRSGTSRAAIKTTVKAFDIVGCDPAGEPVSVSTTPHVRLMPERLRAGKSITGAEPAPVNWVTECDIERL